jgi:hypothetical protein
MSDMALEQRATIAVSPACELERHARLFAALEQAYPVRFHAAGTVAAGDAVLVLTQDVPVPANLPAAGVPVFAAPAVPASPAATAAGPQTVELLAADGVDRRLRGIALQGHVAAGALAQTEGETVLAATPTGAAWSVRAEQHRVSAALPELSPRAVLRHLLVSPHVLAIIALVHFIRRVAASCGWQPPAVKATMLFDDPNLRRPNYGFIDYAALVEHADEHDYHAAMAMIPLDVAGPHRATVELFRRRRDRLSLVVHGNNHVKHELSAPVARGDELSLAAQAIRRVTRFERRTRLRVDRVMTPPHGMCSPAMARALGIVGFDALCSLHPLPWREDSPVERVLAGWEAAEFAGPCAVLPRMPLFASAANIALHAFLDHPVVLYGHHEDLAAGLEPLALAAERVNAVGGVQWAPMEDIVLGNRALRVAGDAAVVRPFSGRMRVALPAAVRTLAVIAPRDGAACFEGWSVGGGELRPFGDSLPCDGAGRELELRLRPVGEIDPAAVPAPPFSPWPLVRRAATELRDRTLPLRPSRSV